MYATILARAITVGADACSARCGAAPDVRHLVLTLRPDTDPAELADLRARLGDLWTWPCHADARDLAVEGTVEEAVAAVTDEFARVEAVRAGDYTQPWGAGDGVWRQDVRHDGSVWRGGVRVADVTFTAMGARQAERRRRERDRADVPMMPPFGALDLG